MKLDPKNSFQNAADISAFVMPSAWFEDFSFGRTMFEALNGNAEALSGVGTGISDIALQERVKLEAKRRKEDDPDASDIAKLGAEQREELAEMQQISVGGIDLSAEEWENIADTLNAPAKLEAVEDSLRAQGRSEAEINDIIYLTRMAANIAEKRSNGLPLTAEEREVEQRLENDPEARERLEMGVSSVRNLPEQQNQNELTGDQTQEFTTEQITDSDTYLEAREQFADQNGYEGTEAVEYAETALAVRSGVSNAGNPFGDTRSPSSEFNTQALGDVQLAEATPLQATPDVSGPMLSNG